MKIRRIVLLIGVISVLLLNFPAWAGESVQWAPWSKYESPVLEGWAIAADPAVIRDETGLRMAYTGFLPEPDRTVISLAVSEDGILWEGANGSTPEPVILEGTAGRWDEQVETAFLLRHEDQEYLYYSGYLEPAPDTPIPAGHIGLAVSADGLVFERLSTDPILSPTPGGYDNDALFSPSVVWWQDQAWMVYTGHCWTDCEDVDPGIRILGAVSDDGLTWTKHQEPVMEPASVNLEWTAGGIGEPEIIQGPDGLFYLFFSAFSQLDDIWTGSIGIARSPHPFGPWEVSPVPIVTSSDAEDWEGTETIAPSVLIEDGSVRLWYHGFNADQSDFAIGVAEASWPVTEIPTDWRRSDANPLAMPLSSMIGGGVDLAVADPTVIHDDEDGLFKAWWSTTVIGLYGPDGPSVNGIRYAESPDGLDWTIQQSLAFSSSVGSPEAWDQTHSETPFVIKIPSNPPERRFLLYYSGGNLDLCNVGDAPCYEVGLAFSPDGRHFTRLPAAESPYHQAGLVLRGEEVLSSVPDVALGIVADPTLVIDPDGTLRMWMSSFGENAAHEVVAFGISHMSSADGIHWTSGADNPLPSLRRPEGIASGQQPGVLLDSRTGRYEMWLTFDRTTDTARIPATLFHAFGFWHATSPDGLNWTPDYGEEPDFRWDPEFPAERWGLLTGVHIMEWENEYRMYFSSWSAVEIPPYFQVPTQAGLVDSATGLCLATRSAIPSPRRPVGRSEPN